MYNVSSTLEPTMNTIPIVIPFNYQNELRYANSLKKQDLNSAKKIYRHAFAKNNSFKEISEILNGINLSKLSVSLTHVVLTHSDGKKLVETFLHGFIGLLNTPIHVDERNQSMVDFITMLNSNWEKANHLKLETQNFQNQGPIEAAEIKKLEHLLKLINEFSSLEDASSLFATYLFKAHPTIQQQIVRAFRNSMLEVVTKNEKGIDCELFALANKVAICGQNISFPYI